MKMKTEIPEAILLLIFFVGLCALVVIGALIPGRPSFTTQEKEDFIVECEQIGGTFSTGTSQSKIWLYCRWKSPDGFMAPGNTITITFSNIKFEQGKIQYRHTGGDISLFAQSCQYLGGEVQGTEAYHTTCYRNGYFAEYISISDALAAFQASR